jgi:hypothetical protein
MCGPGLAWPGRARAFQNLRPGPHAGLGLGLSLAWPKPWPGSIICLKCCWHNKDEIQVYLYINKIIKTELLIIEVFTNKLHKCKRLSIEIQAASKTFCHVVAFRFLSPLLNLSAIFVVTCKTQWSQEKNDTDCLHEG